MILEHTRNIAFILALAFVVSFSFSVPIALNYFSDTVLGTVTIAEDSPLARSLQDVQAKGAVLGVHGYRHEEFNLVSPVEARELLERGKAVFSKSGLVADCFVFPYDPYDTSTRPFPTSVLDAINSTGLLIGPTSSNTGGTQARSEYTWLWRNMTGFNDPRYAQATAKIKNDQPGYILLHAQDWNLFSRALVLDYLTSTTRTGITVQMDDFDVNSPPEEVTQYGELLDQNAVGQLVLGIIPAGTWTGADTDLWGMEVNTIFSFYWWFFILTCLAPLSFFVFWRFLSVTNRNRDESGLLPARSVSVIVPAYNEEREIDRCLRSILAQDYVGPMEVLVVNDGSTDRTADIARTYPVTVIDLHANRGKSYALNTGVSKAAGDVLIFTDSDSYMDAGAVRSLVGSFENAHEAQIVAGNVLISDDDGKGTLLRSCQIIEYRIEQEIGRFLQSLSASVLVCPGPLFAVTRDVVREIRFSEESIIEDAEFTVQALNRSFRIIRDPEALVYTSAPVSLRHWQNQRHRWWYGNLQLWRTHRAWARRNPWMVLNYLGYVLSVISLFMICLLPFLLATYDNPGLAVLRGSIYAVVPLLTFVAFTSPFFLGDRRHLSMLIPYALLYSTLKVMVVSFLYLSYVTQRGVRIKFGARTSVVV